MGKKCVFKSRLRKGLSEVRKARRTLRQRWTARTKPSLPAHCFAVMKRRTSVWVLLTLALAITASHIGCTARDNGTLMVLDGREIDVVGMAGDQWVRLTRNCSGVVRLRPADKNYDIALSLIRAYSPPHSESVRLAGAWGLDQWVLAEVEFVDLLPAVVLINFSGAEPKIIGNAVWSGYTKPWKAAPFIRDYLVRQVPEVPPALADCFDPQSLSFK